MAWSPAPFLMASERQRGEEDARADKERDPYGDVWGTYSEGYDQVKRDQEDANSEDR